MTNLNYFLLGALVGAAASLLVTIVAMMLIPL